MKRVCITDDPANDGAVERRLSNASVSSNATMEQVQVLVRNTVSDGWSAVTILEQYVNQRIGVMELMVGRVSYEQQNSNLAMVGKVNAMTLDQSDTVTLSNNLLGKVDTAIIDLQVQQEHLSSAKLHLGNSVAINHDELAKESQQIRQLSSDVQTELFRTKMKSAVYPSKCGANSAKCRTRSLR